MSVLLYNAAGLMGVWLIVLAYVMMNAGKWRDDSVKFHASNLSGALLVMVSLIGAWNLPVFVMECAWSLVAAYGLWRSYRRNR